MNIPQRSTWLSQSSHGEPLFSQPPCAYCERLICAHDEKTEVGWWHDLERPDELLCAAGERIVETVMAKLRGEVESAISDGFRPVVFVAGIRNWARAIAALGRHQAFGRVYSKGRDDERMTALLHGFSQDIVEAARAGGRIRVPNLEYGKMLDRELRVRLEDFDMVELNVDDPLLPKLKLASRMNPFRYLDCRLYLKNGNVGFDQAYRLYDGTAEQERCPHPVEFQWWKLDFSTPNPLYSEAVADDRMSFMKAFVETFELPMAFHGWEPGGEPPWIVLVQRLRSMSRGIVQYLTTAQQALLALVDEGTLSGALGAQELLAPTRRRESVPMPVRGVGGLNELGTEDDAARSTAAPFPVLIPVIDESESGNGRGIIFQVKWLGSGQPDKAPVVVDTSSGEAVDAAWRDDLRRLTLLGVQVDVTKVGWAWLSEQNRLEISLPSAER